MPKWHFLVVLDSDEYQFLGITMIMHVYHVLIIGCVFYTLCPMSACPYISHASHMHTRCTIDAHTLSLDIFCIHSCQLNLFRPFSTYNTFLCRCHALIDILFHHPQHVMFSLCFVEFFLRCFVFLFELHFLIHLALLMHLYPCSYLLFFPSVLLIYLPIRDKKGKSILENIPKCFVISI